MDVDQNVEFLLERRSHQGIDLAEDLGLEQELRPGSRAMVPADRDPDVVKALGADVVDVLRRVGQPPVLPGRHFQPVTEVGAAEEPPGGLVCGGVVAGDPFHFSETLGPDRAGVNANRDRLPCADLERGEKRLVMPGPSVVRSGHGQCVAGLPDNASPGTLPAGGR